MEFESVISILGSVLILIYLINKFTNKIPEENRSNHDYKDFGCEYDEIASSMDDPAYELIKQKTQQDMNSTKMKEEVKKPDTFGLMYKTLSNIGCHPVSNEDGLISVQYQGENFNMEFNGMYVRIWDPMWAAIKADDPALPKIREAVNVTNYNFGPTVVMTTPDDEGIIGLHSRQDIMLHPACPDNELYIKAMLDSFFYTKEQVRSNFQQINAIHDETQKTRRPVGFMMNPDS